jgi:hypothetical protein
MGRRRRTPILPWSPAEIENVTQVMRKQEFFVGCLYNQETAVYSELFWSHMANAGDSVTPGKGSSSGSQSNERSV